MAATPLLVMEGICKSFSGVPALHEASLAVEAGEVHALVGQNGAGKSTMIKILTGAYRRDAGTIRFLDELIDHRSPLEAQRHGISTIFQEINLVPFRSVAENIFLGREPKRFGLIDWRRIHREARALLQRFDIAIDVTQPLMSFNVAVQQLVAIARAVSFDSRLVIMDEPTSSLDEREVATLFDVIRQLKTNGVAVIFVSHRLDELYAVCDRVTIMRDGATVASRPIAEIDKLELVAKMLGRTLDHGEAIRTGLAAAGVADGHELLSVSHLRQRQRLRDASLTVCAGEIVGLAGLLGAGRTELARAVFGADPVAGGSIVVDGRPVAFRAPADAIHAGIGYCSEDRKIEGIVPDMSVRENLTLALLPKLARWGIVQPDRQRAIVERFVARLGIKLASTEQKIRQLSGGNQQKVLLARWLCLEPRLLLLDEPTRGIDVGAKAEIHRLMRELAASGLGVLMIASEIEELVQTCDRASVLRDGRTVASLPAAELSERAVMAAIAHGDGRAAGALGASAGTG
jgi:ribose transport system ATP-binding protein